MSEQIAGLEKSVAKLEDKISIVELSHSEIAKSITGHGADEVRVLHEAISIIKSRQPVDESDVASDVPSVVDRMDRVKETRLTTLKSLETVATAPVEMPQTLVSRFATARGKFGKRN